jgi:hypothetical protein
MKKFAFAMAPCMSVLLLTACAQTPGRQAAEDAPRLTKKGDVVAWNNATLFGPLPAAMSDKAARLCATLDTDDKKWKPLGYHPRAEDLEGKPFPGGGYSCEPK